MLKFNNFNGISLLSEGGNIKVKNAAGEMVSAEPFKVKDRGRQSKDIHDALKSIHDSYHAETKHHLFGKNASGLTSGSVYAGTTKHFMNAHIPDHEFKKHKPTVGDIDAQIPMEHKDHLATFLKPGDRHGKYTVVGTKKHGTETSAVMRHDNGEHHQFDLEGTHHYQGTGPHKDEQFLHSAHWDDTKSGISGAHHKILINSAGLDKHKFSITHGLRSRTDETDPGTKSPKEIAHKLFGKGADENDTHSFKGVTQLIKRHVHPSQHQAIYDKFKSGLVSIKGKDHKAALDHLRQHLNAKDDIKESVSEKTHHTSVVPMVGFSPISHMGHAKDLGGTLSKLPGTKHIGISSKADLFSPKERGDILKKQWGDKETSAHVVAGAGETIRKAHDSLPKHGKKVLHLLVGSDRKELATGLKKSLEQGKLKEMEGRHFDEIHLHTPEDSDRSHGMSGTKMRQAAADGNEDEFHKHVGKMFSRAESNNIMGRVKSGLSSGAIKVKRPEPKKKIVKEEANIPQHQYVLNKVLKCWI
jgi:hypothetical protein